MPELQATRGYACLVCATALKNHHAPPHQRPVSPSAAMAGSIRELSIYRPSHRARRPSRMGWSDG
eukprot:1639079-Prymnesium_polylepis.1